MNKPISKKEEGLYNSKFGLTDRVEKVKKDKYFKSNFYNKKSL